MKVAAAVPRMSPSGRCCGFSPTRCPTARRSSIRDRGLRLHVSAARRRGPARRPRADGARRRPRRPRRRVGDERARMDRPAVRAREDRRDPRHRQHGAARARDRIPAPAERRRRRSSRFAASAASTISTSCARLARSAGHRVARTLPHLARVIFIGDDCPDDLIPYAHLAGAAADVPDADTRRVEATRRARRRHQHAIHVGHDRVSQRRDALEPQHRQQRLLAGRGPRRSRPRIACACACRCSTASAA